MENNIFVRIDKKATDQKMSKEVYNAHLKYIEKLKEKDFIMAGGFEKENGGLIVFKADSYKKAKSLCKQDPIIKGNYYIFKLCKWNLKYISKVKEVLLSG